MRPTLRILCDHRGHYPAVSTSASLSRLHLSVPVSTPLCLSLCPYLSVSTSLYLSVPTSQSLPLSLSLSFPVSTSVPVSLSLPLCPYRSVSTSQPQPLSHTGKTQYNLRRSV